MTANFKITEHVIFAPIINKTPTILPVFDVCVVPSRQEGLGLSVMEAQSSGIAVVASNVGGIPTLIQDGKTGLLVEPENKEKLAEAVIKLLINKKRAKQMGLEARSFIQANFSVDKMIDKTLTVYQHLTGRGE